jgi:phosphate-selective porin OprO/OprP
MVQALQEQVKQLQAEIEAIKQRPAAPPGIEERVDKIEKKVDESTPVPEDNDFRVYWKEGLRLDTKDGNFKLKVGLGIQDDWGWFDDGGTFRKVFGDSEDGAEFRRVKPSFSGEIYENYEFKADVDVAGGVVKFRDVYVAMNNIPYAGQLKVGRFKEPFSLEEITSDDWTTFLERALPNVFAPSRTTGAQLMNNHFDGRMTWAAGVFREGGDFGNNSDDGGYAVTARVTGLPWYKDDGRKLIHLGAGYTHRNPDGEIRVRQRPEAHLVPVRFLDTGDFAADDIDTWNAEAALVYGPFSAQGEYFHSTVDTILAGDEDMTGWYAQLSYVLTGENRLYIKKSGIFDKINPKRPFRFSEDRGPGAWELAVRYSQLDLTDHFLLGGKEDNFTAGVNWYLNPNMRIMLNYLHAMIDRSPLYDDDFDALQMRFQLAF